MSRGEKGLNDLKFGTFMGRFWTDGTPSMAVKGLTAIDTTQSGVQVLSRPPPPVARSNKTARACRAQRERVPFPVPVGFNCIVLLPLSSLAVNTALLRPTILSVTPEAALVSSSGPIFRHHFSLSEDPFGQWGKVSSALGNSNGRRVWVWGGVRAVSYTHLTLPTKTLV